MKKRQSFFKRHIIAISFLLLVSVYSLYSTYVKEQELKELKMTTEVRLEEIRQLKHDIQVLNNTLDRIDSPEYIEKYSREKFKMIYSDEIIFKILYEDKDE